MQLVKVGDDPERQEKPLSEFRVIVQFVNRSVDSLQQTPPPHPPEHSASGQREREFPLIVQLVSAAEDLTQ